MAETTIPVVHASGSPRQIGRAVGEAMAPMIVTIAGEYFETLHELGKTESATYLSREHFLRLSDRYFVFAREYAPDLMEEVEGIAEASGVDRRLVFALNCYLDFFDLTYPFLADQLLFGCTTVSAVHSATIGGETYIAQNYDVRSYLKKSAYVLEVKPDSGPSAVILCLAGMVGCAGMNSAGISVVINKLAPADSRHGVPYCFSLRKALQRRRLGDAVDAIVSARRASGINYMLGDDSGTIINLETTATNYQVLPLVNDTIVHTNHYVSPVLQDYERLRRHRNTDTIVRHARGTHLLAAAAGNIGLAEIKAFLSDHVNLPHAICRHQREELPMPERNETVASIICRPSAREVLVAYGQPCTHPFVSFAVPA